MRHTPKVSLFLASFGAIGLIAAQPATAGPWGSPKFTMSQSDERFSADGLTTISSEGNRISKRSIAGGTHIDKEGVYLNPIVTIKRGTHEVVSLHFDLFNLTERISTIGAPNSFGRPIRISSLTGEGAPIVLEVRSGEQKYGGTQCNQYMGCSTSLVEGGIVPVSLEQYRRLMSATALVIKIDGTDRSHTYETKDIAPTFISNLVAFHAAYLANSP